MSDETTLLSCPFCGGEAFYNPGYNGGNVECRECGAEGAYKLTEAEAIAAWNTRSAKPCYATDHTHDGCKYSVNRGWVENVAHGTLTAEQVRDLIERHSHDYYGMRQFLSSSYAAIADELNAKLGSGTCHSTTDSSAWCFVCSECGKSFPRNKLHLAHNHGEINYCPNCGKRVER